MPVVGFVGSTSSGSLRDAVAAFHRGLAEAGYVESQNVAIQYRWAEGQYDRLPGLVADLVHRQVAVIELAAKELEMMKEAVPHATRIGVLWNPTTPSHQRALKSIEAAGEKLRVELRMIPARTLENFEEAFSTMTREVVEAFLVVASPLIVAQRVPLARLALKHRLPGMFPFKENVEAGGLMSYGADRDDLYRRAAAYVDKILKGVKPTDLPVEQASKYQLVINLQTAKALSLEVPPTLLARADEVIE